MRPVVIKMPRNNLPKAQTQAWLLEMLNDPEQCHYFAVVMVEDDAPERGNFGTWDAPFYHLDEAEKFRDTMKIRFSNARMVINKGTLPLSDALTQGRNRFCNTWIKSHKKRLQQLSTKKEAQPCKA